MSFFVLHMDKFQKDAVRGIQSHNNRERESHSNPDIDYQRSAGNYDLHGQAYDYAQAIQNRIDDLLLVKAVRKDAVHMCGLIVSSGSAFFENLSPEETRRFFEESKAFLTDFVGAENVISAMVHMDEKTPHMHFLHVPVTPDGRLSAKTIYTRESLKKLQTELPRHLQSRGFNVQRGIEQEPGSAKKHLDTREFKQQQNALNNLRLEAQTVSTELEQRQQQAATVREQLQSYERQAQEAEKELAAQPELAPPSMFNYKAMHEKAQGIIERQKKALAEKSIVVAQNEKLQAEAMRLHEVITELNKKLALREVERAEEQKRSAANLMRMVENYQNATARLEAIDRFFRWNQEANKMHLDYLQEQRQEAARKAAEQKQREQSQAREAQEREQERQQAQERERASQPQRAFPSSGIGLGR